MGKILENKKVANIVLIAATIAFFVALALKYADTDVYYLLANGRYILENGIPTENPFIGEPGVPIVIQNYAWCVLIALCYNLWGNAGLVFLNGVTITFFVAVGIMFLKEKQKTILPAKVFPLLTLAFMLLGGYVSLRPEILTCALIMMQLLAIERFKNSGRWQHLLVVPISMALESNFHSSYIIMHVFFGVCYMLPGVFGMKNTGMDKKKKISASVSLGAGLASSLANPYGIKAVTYIYDALKGGFLSKWNISEQSPIDLYEPTFVEVIVLVIIVIAMTVTKKISSPVFYASIPLAILPFMAVKWISFYPVVMLLIAKDVEDYKIFDILKSSKALRKIAVVFLGIFTIGELFLGFRAAKSVILAAEKGTICEEAEFFENTARYIKETNPDGVVFTANFQYGNIYEFKGIKTFLDARPELYRGKVGEQYLSIYLGYDPFDKDSKDYTLDEYVSIIESMCADYFVVDTDYHIPQHFMGLEKSEKFAKNEELSTEKYLFYERTGE